MQVTWKQEIYKINNEPRIRRSALIMIEIRQWNARKKSLNLHVLKRLIRKQKKIMSTRDQSMNE